MIELPVLLASGVRRTPDLSGIEKCGFEKEMSQKLRHVVRLFVSLGLYTKMTTLGCLTIIKNKK